MTQELRPLQCILHVLMYSNSLLCGEKVGTTKITFKAVKLQTAF